MEGNECYKFSTILNYVQATGSRGIRTVVDIGANVGSICLLANSYFPDAHIYAFEAVEEYFRLACQNTRNVPGLRIFNQAVTSAHLFYDELGEHPRPHPARLSIFQGLPEGGPGWQGGSIVLPDDSAAFTSGNPSPGYFRSPQQVFPIALQQIWEMIERNEGVDEIDLVKFDCEGSECGVLGCSDPGLLRKLRFIVGEYHGIERFYEVMRRKLFSTHKVSLIGTASLGCFFAERRCGSADGILLQHNDGMLVPRPWLASKPLDWHIFNPRYVLPEDRTAHALLTPSG
jgi:Methyltransferase FkbM domain